MIFQLEALEDCWDELQFIVRSHWEETEEYRHGQELNADKERYFQYEDMGVYFMYTARDNGKLVGSFGIYMMRSMHTQKLIATEDQCFILPEYRRNGNFFKLFKFVEADMKKRGVIEVTMTVKTTNKAYKLLERSGYERIAYQYSKHINEV